MISKKYLTLSFAVVVLMSLTRSEHLVSAAVQSVDIDEFTYSSPGSDRVTTDSINVGDSITLFWNTSAASRCESSAKVLRQSVWTNSTVQGWSAQAREFQNPVDGLRVEPKESSRLYLKCFNDNDQTSVEKWIEIRMGTPSQTKQNGTIAGLRGIYYDTASEPITRDEKGSDIVMIRIDPRVSFSWNNRVPTNLITSSQFTTEWKGDLSPRKTGTYSFSLLSDQGGALWINDELIIQGDAMTQQEFSGVKTVLMEVGRTYHIRLKARHSSTTAIAQLSWTDPDGRKEIIPARYLTTDALPGPTSPGKGNGVRATYSQYLHFDTPDTVAIVRTDPTPSLDIPSSFQQKGDLRFDTTWEGTLIPRVTDFYRFYTEADGMVEFSLKGNDQDVSLTSEQEAFEKHQTESLFLEAGKSYTLRFVYHQSKGNASARLLWSRAGNPVKERIPQSQLSSPQVGQSKPAKQGTGLVGTYYNGENFEQKSFTRIDKTINFNWKYNSPKPGPILPDHFSVRWEGSIEAPTTDFYQFSSRIDDRILVKINGQKIFDTSRFRAGQTLYSLPILLRAGERYPISIEYADYITVAYIDLQWANSSGKRSIVPMQYLYPVTPPSIPGTGLRGDYFEGENFDVFRARHTGEYIGFDWGAGSPDPAVPPDHFSVRWTGWIEPTVTDTYTLVTKMDDGVRLWISDKDQNSIESGTPPQINEWHHTPQNSEYQTSKILEAGHRYFIKLEYFENVSPATAQLLWSRKGNKNKEIIPLARLYPEPSPTTTSATTPTFISGSGNGLRGEYFGDENLLNYQLSRIDPSINFNWGLGSPLPGFPTDHFSVRWTGWVEPRYTEAYTFSVLADDGVRLWISDNDQSGAASDISSLIDDWRLTPVPSERRAARILQSGHKYFIKMEYFENTGPASARLYWSSARQSKEIVPQSQLYSAPETTIVGPPPGNGTGLRGRYYRGGDTAYALTLPYPAVERIDPIINFSWRYGAPYYSLPGDNFSVRWEGYVQPQYDGDYTFTLQADDSARLWIGETPIYDNMPSLIERGNNTSTQYSAVKTLQRGHLYRIRVDYAQGGGDSFIYLWWSHPSLYKQIIPQSQLYPPSTPILSPN